MFRHKFCLSSDIGRGEVGNFEGLGLDPSQRFKVLQEEVVTWEARRELNAVVAATLRNPHDGLDLLNLFVVGRRNAIQKSSNLSTQIRSRNKCAQYIFGEDIGEGAGIVFNVIVRDVDML